MSPVICADGSSPLDAPEVCRIDRSSAVDRWRYRCPNNHHARWEDRGGHLLCHSCKEMHGVSPIYRELWDAREEELIPWSAVEIIDSRPTV